MDKDIASLLTLPWATLLVLASGYAGYYVANAGIRDHHKAIDIAFSTIVFGFLASFPYQFLTLIGFGIALASLASFTFSLALGAAWSRWGRRWLTTSLRFMRVSYTDSMPSAWLSMFAETDTSAMQLSVLLTDGTWLHCADLRDFRDRPNGPCLFGNDGDIAMYVTHQKPAGAAEFEEMGSPDDDEWGSELSYIPKERVAQVDIRTKKRQ